MLYRPHMDSPTYLRDLNGAQRIAVEYGISDCDDPNGAGPLLIIAGAGTGKTNTLAHRVAHLILMGSIPERILLLTFTRRAASEMTRRAQRILSGARAGAKSREVLEPLVRSLGPALSTRLATASSANTPIASGSIHRSRSLIAPTLRIG